MTTSNTRGYWIRTIRGWGEDRLSDPQYAELDAVITWYEDSAGERDELKDENAKLGAELAEAVRLLESIGYFADIQVTDARDDILEGGTPDDHAERWERIATFLFKRGFYDTTT